MLNGKKVLLALSGGVDSSVAAVLLKKQGYEVIAAFMKVWGDSKTASGTCVWKDERRDALRVAAKLDIPFLTFDFENEYRAQVASYFFSEYEAGRTPNPDVLCNDKIKFPLLWREAQKLGCEYIATGHHVRKILNPKFEIRNKFKIKNSKWQLLTGRDGNKDQSYFLHRLTQEDLKHTLFPIGEYTKEEVRQSARAHGLPTADKRSTRGLCFIGKVKMPEFLGQSVTMQSGPIFTTAGVQIGEHKGLAPYTIGQRHGFGGGGGTPYFVVEKKPETLALVVGDENDPALYRSELTLTNVHWISGEEPVFPFLCTARIRYRAPFVEGYIRKRNLNKLSDRTENCGLIFSTFKHLRAPAPGQFAVFYDGEVCLGGGVIM